MKVPTIFMKIDKKGNGQRYDYFSGRASALNEIM